MVKQRTEPETQELVRPPSLARVQEGGMGYQYLQVLSAVLADGTGTLGFVMAK